MPSLIERVERHAPPRGIYGTRGISAGDSYGPQSIEQLPDRLLDTDGTGGLPVIERRAVAQGEAGEERSSRQGRGRLQVIGTGRHREPLEFREIDGHDCRVEGHLGPPDRQPGIADRGPQRG